jgi:hypothetical protein
MVNKLSVWNSFSNNRLFSYQLRLYKKSYLASKNMSKSLKVRPEMWFEDTNVTFIAGSIQNNILVIRLSIEAIPLQALTGPEGSRGF